MRIKRIKKVRCVRFRCFQVQTEYKLITSTRTKKREENYAYKKNKKKEGVSDLDASN